MSTQKFFIPTRYFTAIGTRQSAAVQRKKHVCRQSKAWRHTCFFLWFGRQSAVALPCKGKQTKATITLRFFLLCHAKANRRKRHCRLRLFTLVRQWEGNEFCSRFFADVSSLVPSGVTVSRKIIQYSVFPFEFGVAQGPKLQFRYVVLHIRLVCE